MEILLHALTSTSPGTRLLNDSGAFAGLFSFSCFHARMNNSIAISARVHQIEYNLVSMLPLDSRFPFLLSCNPKYNCILSS